MKKLTREMLEKRIRERIQLNLGMMSFVCKGFVCSRCEMFSKSSHDCLANTENMYETILRKVKLEKLLS